MPVTPVFNIPYPDGTTSYVPLQDHFAAIATATENALTTGLGGAPRVANSDSERGTIFPFPAQGNLVVRPDKGTMQQYFGLYNSGSNPGGATPAGWYTVFGKPTTSTIAFTGIYSADPAYGARLLHQNGRIHLEGVTISSSATFGAGTSYTIGTITDATWRPAKNCVFPATMNGVFGQLTVWAATGNIDFASSVGFTGALNLWLNVAQWPLKALTAP